MLRCAPQLKEIFESEIYSGRENINVMMWMSRAALEIVGTGGLGTSIDPLVPDPKAITEYGKSIKNLMQVVPPFAPVIADLTHTNFTLQFITARPPFG